MNAIPWDFEPLASEIRPEGANEGILSQRPQWHRDHIVPAPGPTGRLGSHSFPKPGFQADHQFWELECPSNRFLYAEESQVCFLLATKNFDGGINKLREEIKCALIKLPVQVRRSEEGKRSLLLKIWEKAAGSYLALIDVESVIWRAPVSK